MDQDSMIDLPNLAFDEKIGNKRVRDDHGEVETNIGRLEKRPSGILGVNGGGDGGEDGSGKGGSGSDGGGIIETFISNVFQKNGNGIEVKEGEVDGQVKIDVSDFEVEDTSVDLGIGGGKGGGDGEGGESGGGGGGIINNFISNMFNHNGNGDGSGGDQGINDLSNKVVEKTEDLGGNDGDSGGGGGWMVDSFISNVIHNNGSGKTEEEPQSAGGEPEILDIEKLTKKNDTPSELPSKPVTGRQLKPDDYSERVFFLNNN